MTLNVSDWYGESLSGEATGADDPCSLSIVRRECNISTAEDLFTETSRVYDDLLRGSSSSIHSSNADPQANILITSDDPVRACLADFGFMTIVYDDADSPESTSALGGGTTPFMAPELLSPSMFGKTKCQVSKEADVYAFAMVILQVGFRLRRYLVGYSSAELCSGFEWINAFSQCAGHGGRVQGYPR